MTDNFGRQIDYMRVSLTDRCNYRCVYCMGDDGIEKKSHDDILSLERVFDVIRAFVNVGGKKIRFTGGEPFVRKGAADLIRKTKSSFPDCTVAITTNGVFLPAYIEEIKNSVDAINISIDSLDPDVYARVTRGGRLSDALEGLRVAKEKTSAEIKINAVLMKDVNDKEIRAFADFGRERGVRVRFIETMPFRDDVSLKKYMITSEKIIGECGLIFHENDNNARYYLFPDGAEIGFISALSHKFCADCNRIRLTADGKLLPCLHGNREVDLKPYFDDNNIENAFKVAIMQKPKSHNIDRGDLQKRSMNRIGG